MWMILTKSPHMPFIASISRQNPRSHLEVKSAWKNAEEYYYRSEGYDAFCFCQPWYQARAFYFAPYLIDLLGRRQNRQQVGRPVFKKLGSVFPSLTMATKLLFNTIDDSMTITVSQVKKCYIYCYRRHIS
jgi:hypothetical protein